jgi:hypothetical protein
MKQINILKKYIICFFVCFGIVFQPVSYLSASSQEQEPAFLISQNENQTEEMLHISGEMDLSNGPFFFNVLNDRVVACGEAVELQLIKNNFKIEQLDFILAGLPDGASFSKGVFRWTPTSDQVGTHVFTVGVSDKKGRGKREKIRLSFDVLPLAADEDLISEEEKEIEEEIALDSDSPFVQEPTEKSVNDVPFVHEKTPKNELPAPQSKKKKDTERDDSRSTLFVEQNNFTPASPNIFVSGGSTVFRAPQNQNPIGGSPITISDSPKDEEKQDEAELAVPSQAAAPLLASPNVPVLTDPGKASFNGSFRLEWTDVSAEQYEIQRSTNRLFTKNVVTFFTQIPSFDFNTSHNPVSGYYYYRVRAWNGDRLTSGLASQFSNPVMIGIDYTRDLNILNFPSQGVFTEIPNAPGTVLSATFVDSEAYTSPVHKLSYALGDQFFVGAWFKSDVLRTVETMGSLNMRIRGDALDGYPIRMIIELKKNKEIQGVVFVTGLSNSYQDLSYPFYSKSGTIDEVVIYIEDENQGDGRGTIYIDEFFFSKQVFTPDILPVVPQTAGAALTDDELFDKVEADTAQFFYDEIVGPGFVKDTSDTEYSSIAATGFGLATLAVMGQRAQTSRFWNRVSYQQAEIRATEILSALLAIQAKQTTDSARTEFGVAGFFYHFMNADGTRALSSEVSVVDTAILIAGALTAGEYFGGDVKVLADALYENVEWKFFLNETNFTYHMGWRPESGRGFIVPKEGGFLSSGTYNTATDEILLIALLALGSDVNDPLLRNAYFSYPRTEKTYTAQTGARQGETYTVVNSYFGSLFTYLYAHCFFDFKTLGDDQTYFATDEAPHITSVNWWDNSVAAFKANRQFCIDNSQYYPFAYHENSWGISAVQRPDGRYEGRYGAVPFDNGAGNDGVVALYGPLSSYPFFRKSDYEFLASNEGFQSLRFFYNNYYDSLYGEYGFYDSFDSDGNFSHVYLGIDQGPIVLMMENYRSDMIWNILSQNEKISDALDVVFASGFDWVNYEIRNIVTDDISSEFQFGTMDSSAIASSQQYIKIDTNFKYQTARLVVYTNNALNSIPFQYNDGNTNKSAGLVGTLDPTQVVPLMWTVFDEKRPLGYVFVGDEMREASVQDRLDADFFELDMINARTLLDGGGRLGLYPDSGRTTLSSTLYVYFGADFAQEGLQAQEYKTDTLTFEIYHE